MHDFETVACPQCNRHLQLPAAYMGQQVQCPNCEGSFVAGEMKPKPESPPPVEAVAVEPKAAVPDLELEPITPRNKRPRYLDIARPSNTKSPLVPILVVLGVVGVGFVLLVGFASVVNHRPHVAPNFNVGAPPVLFDPNHLLQPPFTIVPDRPLAANEQREHANGFFIHFAAAMRDQNNAAEMGAFDGERIRETLFAEKLIPDGWRGPNERDIVAKIHQGLLQTSLYRGAQHWIGFEIMTVRQPRPRELIVVTRHPNPESGWALRRRWSLAHRDGRWRVHEVEELDYGIRLSMLLAPGLQLNNPGGAIVSHSIGVLRDAANEVMVKVNFDQADRLLADIRPNDLPPVCAATYHQLIGSIRVRQFRYPETLTACDAAQTFRQDLPGSEYLRAVAFNNLHRSDPALKHARLAQEWLGDDPVVCYEIGLALHDQRRFAEAAPLFRKTLDRHADNKDAYLSLLRCLGPEVKNDDIEFRFIKMRRPQDHFEEFAKDRWNAFPRDLETLKILTAAMRKVDARHPDAAYYQALAFAELNQLTPAIASFQTAVALQGFEARRLNYYTEFARIVAGRDEALSAYRKLPDQVRSFAALGDALLTSWKLDELQELMDVHRAKYPDDASLQLFQAEQHLREERFADADRAFTKAFDSIKDTQVEARFAPSRIRARFLSGDVPGAYRDIPPRHQTFGQLANLCWADKSLAALVEVVDLHAKKDPDDPELRRHQWRIKILEKRFDEAGKAVKAAVDQERPLAPERNPATDFLYDMIDSGHYIEAYRHAPDPEQAIEILEPELANSGLARDMEAIIIEHRKQFPNDPLLHILAGQKAAAEKDWPKAAEAYREGWMQLPEAKRVRWSYAHLYARVKAGQAVQAYEETGRRPDLFRQLSTILLTDKQTDAFEKLLDAQRPQAGNDPEFAAYEARLLLLRGKTEPAAQLLLNFLKDRPIAERNRLASSFVADLGAFDLGVEVYRCDPNKEDAFSQLTARYRLAPDRVKEYSRLIAEHAKHHPNDPRLPLERGDLHMLKNEFEQAAQQYALANARDPQSVSPARNGLIRARIKLGQADDAYLELKPGPRTFLDIANECVQLKDGNQLARLIAAHRKAQPDAKHLASWDVEALWLKKDYAATAKAIEADRANLLKSGIHRWKLESHLVRSLIRAKNAKGALREAEKMNQRKDAPHLLMALALASTGDVPGVTAYLESKRIQRFFIDTCYRDEDLGSLLRGDAFRAVQQRFPPPPAPPAAE